MIMKSCEVLGPINVKSWYGKMKIGNTSIEHIEKSLQSHNILQLILVHEKGLLISIVQICYQLMTRDARVDSPSSSQTIKLWQ